MFSEERLQKEDKARITIRKVLEEYGASIFDISFEDYFSLHEIKDIALLQALKEYPASKFDAFVMRNGEFYVVEYKYKSKEQYRNIVNKNAYDIYWNMREKGVPFLMLIYTHDTKRVWKHIPQNPKDFETAFIQNKTVYLIPYQSIARVHPSFITPIDAWFTIQKDMLKKILHTKRNSK